ncbi:hypothetical protein KSP40_PGU020255 [Platanthera guangdongensis]|uniref:Uncharacterized protein n=1 Tax=Platanthera guangdongensis TaxID=2320717 RepID=A0ABR2MIB6_9ASPA
MEFQSPYGRLGRRSHRTRGFRIRRMIASFRLLYIRCLQRIKKALGGRRSSRREKNRGGAAPPEHKLLTFRRSNTFYAEAIADCLDFIRKTSAAVLDDASKIAAGETSKEGGGAGR